jgi:hypothetical protein
MNNMCTGFIWIGVQNNSTFYKQHDKDFLGLLALIFFTQEAIVFFFLRET